jgi:hypothetical protein
VLVTSFAKSWVHSFSQNYRRLDATVCDEALRNTLIAAADTARKSGANAVVNITSKFLDESLDSPTKFACNSGTASATVDLMVQFATFKADQVSAPGAEFVATGKLKNAPTARIMPPASDFAAFHDVEAIPYLGPKCREYYANRYLKVAMPKAFAISPLGHCYASNNFGALDSEESRDPAVRALARCAAYAGIACQLYSVDHFVVFKFSGLTEANLKPVPFNP